MNIPTSEQETVVQYDRNGETMTIYTSDTTQMTRLDKIYSRHKARTVSINGVNLFGVRRILVDAYELRQDGDCSIGLYFYGSTESADEMALFLVDAAQTNLHVTISDDGKLVCLDTVDKLGRRF